MHATGGVKSGHLMTYQKKQEVRGVAHEYWIERRRARQQARKRGEGGPYRSQATSQEKKENKKLDPWGGIWENVRLFKQ